MTAGMCISGWLDAFLGQRAQHRIRRCADDPRAAIRRGAVLLGLLATLGVSLPLWAQDTLSASTDNAIPDLTTRIIGGNRTLDGDWPSVVALVRVSPGLSLRQRLFCGGSLVSPTHIVTAAHCMFDLFDNQIEASSLRVVAGVTNLRPIQIPDEAIVSNIIVHPEYQPSMVSAPNDIALLELANSLPFETLSLYDGDASDLVGLDSTVVGWGAVDFTNPRRPVFREAQREAVVPVVSQEACNAPESYNGLITDRQICAGFIEGGVDSCVGDSGGPLIIQENGERFQVGVVSFGRGCAAPNFYGIYTSVTTYIDWLRQFTTVDTLQRSPTAPGGVIEPLPDEVPDVSVRNGGGGAMTTVLMMLLLGLSFRRMSLRRPTSVGARQRTASARSADR